MMLKSVRIENYRSIRDATLYCDSLTALVGANGSGKSSFLRAIELFGSEKPDLVMEDYYGGRADDPIRITAIFENLSDSARTQFEEYTLDGKLTVTRILKWSNGKCKPTYRGTRPHNPDFVPARAGDAEAAKKEYEVLRQADAYKDLPKCSTGSARKTALRQWEKNHPNRCGRKMDEEMEFKPARKFPEQFVQILYVPPVRDAAEDTQEAKNSVLSKLMDLAVNSSLAADGELAAFKEDAQRRYGELMRTAGQTKLRDLSKRITKTVQNFVPVAKVEMSWGSIDLLMESKAEIRLREDGYESAVDGAGHGLQRILIMSMLQHLKEEQADRGNSGESPALVVLIDEPELYQHPNRQRHMSEVLRSLADGQGAGAREIQVIYSTHSPHFVRIDELDRVRLVRKTIDGIRSPMVTRVSGTSLSVVAGELAKTSGHREETADKLARRLRVIMTPMMNEGFFADVVVLVEGPSDRAALTAVAKSMDRSLESLGISVISCDGKDRLARPAMIFRQLEIPLYAVWDGDYKNQGPTLNREILRVLGLDLVERPSGVNDAYACLEDNLEEVIRGDLGDKLDEYRHRCANDLGEKNSDDLIKKPHVVSYLIETAARDGLSFPTLENIVRSVIKMCPGSMPTRSRRVNPRTG